MGFFLFFDNIMTKLNDSWGSKVCEFPEIFMNSKVTKQFQSGLGNGSNKYYPLSAS